MNLIGKNEKDGVLTFFIAVDDYELYEVVFEWHKSSCRWVIKSVEDVVKLDLHKPLGLDEIIEKNYVKEANN